MKKIFIIVFFIALSFLGHAYECHWKPVPVAPNNLILTASVSLDGEALTSGTYELGAFAGDVCRGATIIQPMNEQGYAFQTIIGNDDEVITFRLYNLEYQSEVVIKSVSYSCVFESDAWIGTIDDPQEINFISEDRDYHFLGSVDSSWKNLANWKLKKSMGKEANATMLPGPTNDVILEADVDVDTLATVRNITTSGSVDLVVKPSRSLHVVDALSGFSAFSGNTITLQADENLIDQRSQLGTLLVGNIRDLILSGTVEVYFDNSSLTSKGWDADWHFLGSPVKAQPIDGQWTPTDPDEGYDFYLYSEERSSWLNVKSTTLEPGSEHNAFYNINGGMTMVPGTGYLVAYQNAGKHAMTGIFNNNDVSKKVTSNGAGYTGFNYLSNPYTAYLDWDSETASWDFSEVYGYPYPAYYVYDDDYDAYSIYIKGGYTINDGQRMIAPCQGFFVKMAEDLAEEGTMFTLPLDACVSASSLINYDGKSGFRDAKFDNVKVHVESEHGDKGEALVAVGTDKDTNFRMMSSMNTKSLSVYFSRNNKKQSIIFMKERPERIPLYFKAGQNGNHTITLADSCVFKNVKLFDRIENKIINITNEKYSFTANTNDNPYRFDIILDYSTENIQDIDNQSLTMYQNGDYLILPYEGNVEIFDFLGRKVLSTQTNEKTIKIKNISKGFYVIIVKNSLSLQSCKILIY